MLNGMRLKFDDRFNERPIKDQLDYLHKLAASQNDALDKMQNERNALAQEVVRLKAQLQNAETALVIQKNITRDALTKQNEDNQAAAERMHELETRVKAQDRVIKDLNGDKH